MVLDVEARRPAAALRPFVERYVGYRLEGFEPGMHRGLPSRQLTFIVSLGAPVDMLETTQDGESALRMQAFVGGLDTRAAHIRHDGNQHDRNRALPARHTCAAGATRRRADRPGGRARRRDRPTGRGIGRTAARHRGLDPTLRRDRRSASARISERSLPQPEVMHVWHRCISRPGRLDLRGLARMWAGAAGI
jgi:hypothetical protein